MKKLIYLLLVLPLLISCSSSDVQKNTIQMSSVKWTWEFMDSYTSEEEVSKQLNLFELIPGAQKFGVATHKQPGDTWYQVELALNVRLKSSVDVDFDKIFSDINNKELAIDCANIYAYLLDRNGERIKMVDKTFGGDLFLIMFNDKEFCEEWLVDYLTFLQSEPGTEFQLYFWATFGENDVMCAPGFSRLAKEVKGVELKIKGIDREFEKYVGEILK